jgi:UDPglucose 6-dehydrogenase
MKICIIGAGYVGLVTGCVLANIGNKVTVVEKDEEKLKMLKNNLMPFFEEGMDELLNEVNEKNMIEFENNLKEVKGIIDIFMISVGTPLNQEGIIDMTAFNSVIDEISSLSYNGGILVIKSTVPIGTSTLIEEYLNRGGKRWITASNPEFLRQGSALKDTIEANRIIIGTNSKKVAKLLERLYTPLKRPILIVDRNTSEMIKYASNAFLATKISFANEISTLCEKVGADIKMVVKGIAMDPRIGGDFLGAGIGYGGSCLSKDLSSLINTANKNNVEAAILKATETVNQRQRMLLPYRLKEIYGTLKGLTVALLGITFKPGTDDLRDAPSLDIIRYIIENGADVRVYDPQDRACKNVKNLFPEIYIAKNCYDALSGADAILLLTEWSEIKDINWKKARKLVNRRLILDGRNFLEIEDVEKYGFKYIGIGRGVYSPDSLKSLINSCQFKKRGLAKRESAYRGGINLADVKNIL